MIQMAATLPRWFRAVWWAGTWFVGLDCLGYVACGLYGASVSVLFAAWWAVVLVESQTWRPEWVTKNPPGPVGPEG